MVTRRALLAVCAVAIAVTALKLAVPSDERRIRRIFDRAAELLGKSGAEPVFTAAAKSRDLAALIASGARFSIPERNIDVSLGGGELARQIALARSQAQFIKVAFEGMAIDFTDEDTAIVSADILFSGTSDLMGFSGRDTRELTATMKRGASSGKWQFAAVRLKPVIEK